MCYAWSAKTVKCLREFFSLFLHWSTSFSLRTRHSLSMSMSTQQTVSGGDSEGKIHTHLWNSRPATRPCLSLIHGRSWDNLLVKVLFSLSLFLLLSQWQWWCQSLLCPASSTVILSCCLFCSIQKQRPGDIPSLDNNILEAGSYLFIAQNLQKIDEGLLFAFLPCSSLLLNSFPVLTAGNELSVLFFFLFGGVYGLIAQDNVMLERSHILPNSWID